jgi:type I restriction enzyme S subunit
MKPQGKLLQQTNTTNAWEQRKLGEIGTIETGNTPDTTNPAFYSSKGTPWITPTDIKESLDLHAEKTLTDLGVTVARTVPAGSILCTCIASIGKNAITQFTCGFNQQINALTPKLDLYDPYFLFAESKLWSAQMKRSAAAGTMQIVNKREFASIGTFVPSLAEQRLIGDFFAHLDNLITLHQRKCYVNQLSLCLFTKLQADAACVRS